MENIESEENLKRSPVLQAIKSFVNVKLKLMFSFMHVAQAEILLKKQNYGEALGHYEAACEKITSADSACKDIHHEELKEIVKNVKLILENQYKRAEAHNDNIYHARKESPTNFPPKKDLFPCPEFQMPYSDQEPLFKKVMPFEAHLSMSKYDAMKDDLMKNVLDQVSISTEELLKFKATMPDKDELKLPDDSDDDMLKNTFLLLNSMKPEIESKFSKPLVDLGNLVDFLDFTKLQPSIKNAVEQALPQTQTTLETGFKINDAFSKFFSVEENDPNLMKTLSNSIADSSKLKITPSNYDQLKTLDTLYSKISEMENQRSAYIDRLKNDLQNDNIQNEFLTSLGPKSSESQQLQFFEVQLKKHEKNIDIIQKNLSAQNNILDMITRVNMDIAPLRVMLQAYNQEKEMTLTLVNDGLENYDFLSQQIQEGLKFFGQVKSKLEEVNSLSNKREIKPPVKVEKKKEEIPDELAELIKNDPEMAEFLKTQGGWNALKSQPQYRVYFLRLLFFNFFLHLQSIRRVSVESPRVSVESP